MDLKNKTVLITGASSGIGEALAYLLADEVGTLILVARRLEKLQKIKEKICKDNLKCVVILFGKDISIRKNQMDMLAALKQDKIDIEILINNAGLGDEGFFHQSEWDRTDKSLI